MSIDQYRVVFDGRLVPGMSLESVKSNLALLFKCDVGKVERLFDCGSVNIKRGLSALDADRYLNALQRAGALAYKEPEAPHVFSLSIVDDTIAETSNANDQMECPKCGHAQLTATVCDSCGIVIEKYLARQKQRNQNSSQSQNPLQPYAPPQAGVGEATAELSELKVFTTEGRIGRLRYLAWSMASILAGLGLAIIISTVFAASTVFGSILAVAAVIGFLLVSIQIGVQRLHDLGWSGWFMLLYLVPVVGNVFPLVVMVLPGNGGINRFGPPQPPNSRAVKILAALWLLFPVIGLLSASVLPTYR